MNNKHLSWIKEINNNFIIASRAYFLQVWLSVILITRRSLTRLGFQLQVVSTWSVIIRRLSARSGSDSKSPVLNKSVFITTRNGFIINRQNMGGVINTQDLGYHPYYKKLVSQWCDSMSHVWYISYLIILKCSLGYNPGLYVGHYDPSGGKPLGHFKLVVCRNRLNKAWL